MSDKIPTQEIVFFVSLSLLEPGDAILTDQGLKIQVETSQQLSRVRIHIKLVIGLKKNKRQNTQREPYRSSIKTQ